MRMRIYSGGLSRGRFHVSASADEPGPGWRTDRSGGNAEAVGEAEETMKLAILGATLGLVLAASVGRVWGQHEGHDGMGGMGGMPPWDREAAAKEEAQARRNKLTKLQDKIDEIEAKLEDPKLPAKKRPGLEKKLKRLYDKKDQLLGDAAAESTTARRPASAATGIESCGSGAPTCTEEKTVVYACPMGHYTSDKPGACPKCGMNLEKR